MEPFICQDRPGDLFYVVPMVNPWELFKGHGMDIYPEHREGCTGVSDVFLEFFRMD